LKNFWETMKRAGSTVIIFSAVIGVVLYISDIKGDIREVKHELKNEINDVRHEVNDVRNELQKQISDIKQNDIAHLQLEQEYQGKVLRLMADYIMTGDKKAFAIGLRTIDEWHEHARL